MRTSLDPRRWCFKVGGSDRECGTRQTARKRGKGGDLGEGRVFGEGRALGGRSFGGDWGGGDVGGEVGKEGFGGVGEEFSEGEALPQSLCSGASPPQHI